MHKKVRSILEEFDQLTKKQQQDVTAEVIRRMYWPPMTDEDFVHCAEELFLELDRKEAAD